VHNKSPHILISNTRKNTKTLGKVINLYTDKNLICKTEKQYSLLPDSNHISTVLKDLISKPLSPFHYAPRFNHAESGEDRGAGKPFTKDIGKNSCFPLASLK